LHKAGYIHRNLKPENILLHNNEIMLSDLCFARDINQLTKSSTGTFSKNIIITKFCITSFINIASAPE